MENGHDSLSLEEAQAWVDRYISQFEIGYFSPLAMIARLAEELGELSREVNHRYGEKPKKKSEAESDMENELGDLFFVLISFANSQRISLDEALRRVMKKYETRDADRWARKKEQTE